MTNNWQTYKLSEICEIISGGTPKTSIAEYWNGNIFWLSVKDFNTDSKYVYKSEKTITELGLKNSSTNILQKGDIIISARGTVGELAMIPYDMAFNQSCYGLRAKEMIESNFLYYLLKNNINILKNNTHGSVFDTITRNTFDDIEISLPPLGEQKKIAGVLGVLDDKIELNNKINQNLETQVQTLFKSWFVDKEYSIAENTTLGNICKCKLGGTPSRVKPEYWNGSIAWINSGEVNNFRITKASEYITELGLQKSATKLLPKKTTVLAITGATLGQISLLEIDSCANQSVVGILENETLPYEFIYPFICYNIQDLISHQTGGAQQHINKQNVESLPLALPTKDLINDYRKIVKPIFDMIAKNCFENEKLIAIRDALLPKLMSGEIDVENLPQSAIIPNE